MQLPTPVSNRDLRHHRPTIVNSCKEFAPQVQVVTDSRVDALGTPVDVVVAG